ncbi:uncharacterized protein Z519_05493 [Cladophialophora bantiana CBS 173.52]|uniref:ferric-chelate reductase (NADPH) n=1 Tax=Cladophialophora bantiana (strain ATCC 10958 / CBS 173.52 / CDC B-1940 / NIH 8579) TaxID=1442370 RepID=A0A0D2G6F3_CLAB1|nr:uncharacterized protein Z519_05493 [Cladophialophora bantiana CBS 173.52]KIW94177.1 hypothetical protein Z519_05493 [Cladophialophora bantiana CBS 173.52]
MHPEKSLFWLFLLTNVLLVLCGTGSGNGAGSTKEVAAPTVSGSKTGSIMIMSTSTETSITSSEATETAAPASDKNDDETKGDTQSGSSNDTGTSSPQGAKSGGEETTTPIDPVVIVPLFLLAGFAVVLFIGQRLLDYSRAVRLRKTIWENAPRVVTTPSTAVAIWKRVSYSPLWGKRRSREFRPFKWLNMGTLPTRLESILMMLYFVLNMIFALATVDWSQAELGMKMDNLRNHTGTLATANLIPLVLTAGRNNPLIPILHVPFDTFNLMHRFLGRLVVVETLLHIAAVLITKVSSSGWGVLPQELWGKELVLYGFIAGIMFVTLTIQAWSPFRHAFYEFFLHFHILLSIGALITLWYHLADLQQQYLMIGVFLAWALERATRVGNIIWRNTRGIPTKVEVGILPADTIWLRVRTPRSWNIKAGQHIYLYIPSIGLWTSHPFSIAWTDDEASGKPTSQVRSMISACTQPQEPTLYLLIKCHNGFTRRMWKKAARAKSGTFSAVAFAEGPYGGLESLSSFRSVILVAGGVGITHQLLYLRELIEGYHNRAAAIRRVTLVWSIRTLDQVESVQPFLQALLTQHAQCTRRENPLSVSILIFASLTHLQKSVSTSTYQRGSPYSKIHRPRASVFSTASTTPMMSDGHASPRIGNETTPEAMDYVPFTGMHDSASVEVFNHRANIYALLNNEIGRQIGAMYVSVCGPGGLADDVRDAVREHLKTGDTDLEFYEESFSW